MTDILDRLLDRLEPKQRHLAFLVGLLVLTFVLTVMLAFKAHRSELARQQQAQAVLHDLSAKAAQEWMRYFVTYASGPVVESFRGIAREFSRDRHMPLARIAAGSRPERLCDCADPAPGYFSIPFDGTPPEAAGGGALPAGLVDAVLAQVSVAPGNRLSDSLAVSMVVFDTPAGAAGAATLLRLGPESEIVRAVGFHVSPDFFREYLSRPFDELALIPQSLARGKPNSYFFSTRASRAGVVAFNTGGEGEFAATEQVPRGAFTGFELDIGIRDGAAAHLLVDGAVTSGVPLLLVLLFAICGLIFLALVLVRREAELVRLRADFISGVSHELRTPLAQIRMFTETLLFNRVRSDIERRRSLEIIDQEARRLTHLVENVLLFSKSEGGRKTPLAPEPTELAAEVRRAVESFGPMCRTRGVTLRTELQEGIIVAVDRGALRQVLVNLVDNALKYGPAGQRVTVGVALFDDSARLWVDDEGPGIPEAERERVFDSFYRLPRDIATRSSGSGIGLAVVRELTRLHGGAVRVASAPGGGARIVVQFPDAYLRTEPSAEFAAAS
jgi:signal transduction histidine kinase